jgi:hypothetical protein
MQRNLRDPAKEKYWREILARFQSSGLSMKRFCLQEGLNHLNLSSWKYIIRKRNIEAKRKAQLAKNQRQGQTRRQTTKRLFVPVVVPDEKQAAETVRTGVVAEITFSNHCVRIFNGADATTLQTLLRILKEEARAGDQQHQNISLHPRHGYAQEF